MNTIRRHGLIALCVSLAFAAGVAMTQPAASNWRAQDGTWNIGYILNIKSGGTEAAKSGSTVQVESGATFQVDAGATDTHNSTTTLGAAITASSATKNHLSVTVDAGATSEVVSGLSLGDASYGVFLEPTGALTNTSIGSKTASGFTLSCATASTTTTVRALIVHY